MIFKSLKSCPSTFFLFQLFLPLCCLLTNNIAAQQVQKKLVGMESEKDWPGINSPIIANDGRSVCYNVSNHGDSHLIVQATNSDWKVDLGNAEGCFFTQNSKNAVYKRNDSIGIMPLDGVSASSYLTDISSFQIVKYGDFDDLLIYTKTSEGDDLFIRDMKSEKEVVHAGVKRYWPMLGGKVLLMEVVASKSNDNMRSLEWFDMASGQADRIWAGGSISRVLLTENGSDFIFSGTDEKDALTNRIWRYRRENKRVDEVLNDRSEELGKGGSIGNIVSFNAIDDLIYFSINESKAALEVSNSLGVNVWSYKDAKLQSEQLLHLRHGAYIVNHDVIFNIRNRKLIQFGGTGERMLSTFYPDKRMHYLLLEKDTGGNDEEWNWNYKSRGSIILVSLADGSRRTISMNICPILAFSYILSYNENDVFYYSAESAGYCCYNTNDGRTINISKGLKKQWTELRRSDEPDSAVSPYPIAGLIKNTDAILVYDRHGIVELNPTGDRKAIDLTRRSLLGEDIEFRLAQNSQPLIDLLEKVYIKVYNRNNKKEAFLRIALDSLMFTRSLNFQSFSFADVPQKARDTDLYIVSRMTAEEQPNLFFSTDLKTFRRITSVRPESGYNWMTNELVTWRTLDGSIDLGILYKPEDFDENKKYPLIFYYYERCSDGLYSFQKPEASGAVLNIPFFVSHGYLVFTPDIHYQVGWPGKSAYNDIVSGARFLAKRKYVDVKRIGLEGASFGGFETNYVITHSHLFAAATSASGMSDFISAYGSIIGDGSCRQSQYELYRDRIGATLWERPDLYIENSPIFRADKVTTPLLLMANNQDDNVPVQQGIEFFTALRRLGKKAWMLQYDGQGHQVYGEASNDLTIRMFQFFNYYLKDTLPPVWMTKGVLAADKGIISGLDLDTSGPLP